MENKDIAYKAYKIGVQDGVATFADILRKKIKQDDSDNITLNLQDIYATKKKILDEIYKY